MHVYYAYDVIIIFCSAIFCLFFKMEHKEKKSRFKTGITNTLWSCDYRKASALAGDQTKNSSMTRWRGFFQKITLRNTILTELNQSQFLCLSLSLSLWLCLSFSLSFICTHMHTHTKQEGILWTWTCFAPQVIKYISSWKKSRLAIKAFLRSGESSMLLM